MATVLPTVTISSERSERSGGGLGKIVVGDVEIYKSM